MSKNNIKYIEDFWSNLEEYSKDVNMLLDRFEYSFLNDFIDNSKKWKVEIDLINDDLFKYYKYHKVDIEDKNIEITFDIFVGLFLEIGKNYIERNKGLNSKDMENIIKDIIAIHIANLDIDINIQKPVQTAKLSESIPKLKVFY